MIHNRKEIIVANRARCKVHGELKLDENNFHKKVCPICCTSRKQRRKALSLGINKLEFYYEDRN